MKANKLIERTVKHWSIGGRDGRTDVLTPDISNIERCRHTNRKYSKKEKQHCQQCVQLWKLITFISIIPIKGDNNSYVLATTFVDWYWTLEDNTTNWILLECQSYISLTLFYLSTIFSLSLFWLFKEAGMINLELWFFFEIFLTQEYFGTFFRIENF